MASSAAQTIPGSAHIHALHQKAHQKAMAEESAPGESFSDLLAETGDARPQTQALPQEKTARAERPAAADDKAAAKNDAAPDAPEAKAEAGGKEEDVAEGGTGAAKPEPDAAANEPANDNENESVAVAAFAPLSPEAQARLQQAAPQAPASEAMNGAKDAAKPAAASSAPDGASAAGEATIADAAAPQFEQALQDAQETKAEPTRASDAAQPKPVEMKPAAEITTVAMGAGNATTHATHGTDRVAITMHTAPDGADAPLPTPDVNQFAIEVAAKSQGGAKQFDIRLDPPELGRVDVRLSIDATGKAEAHLSADEPQTLDLLQKDAAVLARALRDAGLNLAQDGLNFSLKNQQQGGNGNERRPGGRQPAPPRAIHEPAAVSAHLRHGLGLLDIRV